jgi:hypothetical protein
MNFFLANCLKEDNKCAETGKNTDELQTNKKQETRWRRKKKLSSGDSAGQQRWPSEPRPVGQGNEYFRSPDCWGAGRSRNGCRIRRLGFGAHLVRVFVFFAHRFLSNSTAPRSSFPKFSFPYQWRWVGAHFATSSVSCMETSYLFSFPQWRGTKKLYFGIGQGSERILLVELFSKVPHNTLCKMGGHIQNNFSLVE